MLRKHMISLATAINKLGRFSRRQSWICQFTAEDIRLCFWIMQNLILNVMLWLCNRGQYFSTIVIGFDWIQYNIKLQCWTVIFLMTLYTDWYPVPSFIKSFSFGWKKKLTFCFFFSCKNEIDLDKKSTHIF